MVHGHSNAISGPFVTSIFHSKVKESFLGFWLEPFCYGKVLIIPNRQILTRFTLRDHLNNNSLFLDMRATTTSEPGQRDNGNDSQVTMSLSFEMLGRWQTRPSARQVASLTGREREREGDPTVKYSHACVGLENSRWCLAHVVKTQNQSNAKVGERGVSPRQSCPTFLWLLNYQVEENDPKNTRGSRVAAVESLVRGKKACLAKKQTEFFISFFIYR